MTLTEENDPVARLHAENQLQQAAETDFTGYLIALAQELVNEATPSHIRVAAGITLKNAIGPRDLAQINQGRLRWLTQVSLEDKAQIRKFALQTLHARDRRIQNSAALFIFSIVAIELPRNEWPDLMETLAQNVTTGNRYLRHSSLIAISYICESQDTQLRAHLPYYSNDILTAVIYGVRCEVLNQDIRLASITALCDVVEMMRLHLHDEFEREYILLSVLEATKAEDIRVRLAGLGCFNSIIRTHYEMVPLAWKRALAESSLVGMRSDDYDIAKLAVEFWCIVCERGLAIQTEGLDPLAYDQLARKATDHVVPLLLHLMCRGYPDDGEYSVACAAHQALSLYAQCVQNDVVPSVANFIKDNVKNESWERRAAAVAAFGAIMDGPMPGLLETLIKAELPHLQVMMEDSSSQVKVSVSCTLGRICDCCPAALDPERDLGPMIDSLLNSLVVTPTMAGSCCRALERLIEHFAADQSIQTNFLSKHFQRSVEILLHTTSLSDTSLELCIAGYELLALFSQHSADDCLELVASLMENEIQRLDQAVSSQQGPNIDNGREALFQDLRISEVTLILIIIQRLGTLSEAQADRIIHTLLHTLSVSNANPGVCCVIVTTFGAVAHIMKDHSFKYVDRLRPLIENSLTQPQDLTASIRIVGLVTDLVAALNGKRSPAQCHEFVKILLGVLDSSQEELVTAALEALGDIALTFSGNIDAYLDQVGQKLQQVTSSVTDCKKHLTAGEYRVSVRAGILFVWECILYSYKDRPSTMPSLHFCGPLLKLLQDISRDESRPETLTYSSMCIIRAFIEVFPKSNLREIVGQGWVQPFIHSASTNPKYSTNTSDIAISNHRNIKHYIPCDPDIK